MECISQAEFAKLKGVSVSAVNQAMKTRLADAVVMRQGKKVLRKDLALELWTSRTKVSHRNRRKAEEDLPDVDVGESRRLPTAGEIKALVASLPEDEIPDLNISQARREHYQAERQRVAALRDRQEVGSIEEMRQEAATLAMALRDSILAVSDRVAGRVASMNDQQAIRQLIDGELKTALRALRDMG